MKRFRNFANGQSPPLRLFRFPSIARTDWTSHSIRGELLSLAVDCGISRLRHPVAGVLSLSSVPDFPHFPCVPFHGLSHQRFSLTARVGVCALERYWICVTAKTRSHFRFEISSQSTYTSTYALENIYSRRKLDRKSRHKCVLVISILTLLTFLL